MDYSNTTNSSDLRYYNNIDNVTLFWYVVIFILIIFIFSNKNIGLNVVFGTIIAMIVIHTMYSDYTKTQLMIEEHNTTKKNLIVPNPIKSIKYEQIVNFLFSIQDLYDYNPQSYEDMIEHIDYFFNMYEEVLVNNRSAGYNYQLMNDQKKNILNSLQAIIYKMPINTEYDQKLENAVGTLRNILNGYLDKVNYFYKNDIYINGYNINTKIIHKGPDGYDPSEKIAGDTIFSVL